MGRRGYSTEFRRRVVDLVGAGRKVADVARDLEISEQIIYVWRRQDEIDRGVTTQGSPEPPPKSGQFRSTIMSSRRPGGRFAIQSIVEFIASRDHLKRIACGRLN
jgi:transposase-like protein